MKTNFHTHHYLCRHAIGNVFDYCDEAIKNNFDILGFSDHGPINIHTFPRMDLIEFNNIYLKEIEEAKIKYPNLKIYTALELEYQYLNIDYYKSLLNNVDYLILGTHYYSGYVHTNSNSSYNIYDIETLKKYAKLICDALDTKLFKILAHPDLFFIGYNSFDDEAISLMRQIIEAAIRNDVFIEFNANGYKRGKKVYEDGYVDYMYPNTRFFKLVSEYENHKVVVNRDCHSPIELGDKYYIKANTEARKLGLNVYENIF